MTRNLLCDTWEKSILGRGCSQCKGLEAAHYQEKVKGGLSFPGQHSLAASIPRALHALPSELKVEGRTELGGKCLGFVFKIINAK